MRTGTPLTVVVPFLILAAVAGCATGTGAPASRAQVKAVMQQWKDAMIANDMARLAPLYSDSFTSEFGDKAEIMAEMADLARRVAEQDGRLDLENADIIADSSTASVKPVSVGTRKGAVCRSFYLAKENGRWVIVRMGRK